MPLNKMLHDHHKTHSIHVPQI